MELWDAAKELRGVVKQDNKLTSGIYVDAVAEENDGVPFEEKPESPKARLARQFDESDRL